jgi:hypothetical protein
LPINKEERETCVELEFATLNSKLELERAKDKEVEKWVVGRPRKELVAVLHTQELKEEEPRSKKAKVRGSYTNWFVPSLWEPIFAAVKQHQNLTSALHHEVLCMSGLSLLVSSRKDTKTMYTLEHQHL